MSSKQIQQSFLEPGNLSLNDLEHLLGDALKTGGDFADLYFQSARVESWVLENQQVKSGSHRIDKGVGVRVNDAEKTGFAYTDVLDKAAIAAAVETARSIVRHGQNKARGIRLNTQKAPLLYLSLIHI